MKRSLLQVSLLVLLILRTVCQTDRGTIRGTVEDLLAQRSPEPRFQPPMSKQAYR